MNAMNASLLGKMSKILMVLALGCFIVSCGDDDGGGTSPGGGGGDELKASFQAEPSDSDWKVVTFTDYSENAESSLWDFGDNTTSTEINPVHTYSAGGDYEVILTVSRGSESKSITKTVMIVDPNAAAQALTGGSSKTWKLYREGISMSLGTVDNPVQHWPGLSNNGERPCLYEQEFTFHADGKYEIDLNGMFWGEFGVFNNVGGCDDARGQECFEAIASNMVNACGDDVSAWLNNTHQFDFDPSAGELTLSGDGVWIGIPKLGTNGESSVPFSSVTADVTIEELTGYDLLHVEFLYGADVWPITYVSYSDASLEPELETDIVVVEFGEDLPDLAPSELSRTFVSADAADWVLLDTVPSGSKIYFGVDNPDGSGTKVGQFDRIADSYQELQMQTAPDKHDIQFDNLSSISIDVYLPSTNDYAADPTMGLSNNMVIGFGDFSATMNWWERLVQYEADNSGLAADTWHTLTFDLSAPNTGDSPYDRDDLDMVFIGFGGSGHATPGTFFIRNLVIN